VQHIEHFDRGFRFARDKNGRSYLVNNAMLQKQLPSTPIGRIAGPARWTARPLNGHGRAPARIGHKRAPFEPDSRDRHAHKRTVGSVALAPHKIDVLKANVGRGDQQALARHLDPWPAAGTANCLTRLQFEAIERQRAADG
jgi:hypothetical protein